MANNNHNAILSILKHGPTIKAVHINYLQKKFRYREGEDLDHCQNVLRAIAAKRYSEELHEARDHCIKRFGNNVHQWKECIPHWCLDHPNWFSLYDIFATEEGQGVSQTSKANRLKFKRTIAHHGGSASTHQHFGKLVRFMNTFAN
jgi:hypothetical protein